MKRRTSLLKINRHGFGLISALLASTVAISSLLAISRLIQTGMNGSRHIALVEDIETIRRQIIESLDCNNTLATGLDSTSAIPTPVNTTAPSDDCNPASSTHKFLLLRDKNNLPLTQSLQNAQGSFQYTGRSGEWHILTECDRITHTLLIRAARNKGNDFAKDPFTKMTYGFSPNNSLYLFGGNKPKICQAQLGGTPPSGCQPGTLCNGITQFIPLWTSPTSLGVSSFFQSIGGSTDGYLGIGTTTPGKRLHIVANSENLLRLENSSTPSQWDFNIRNGNFVLGDNTATTDRFMIGADGAVGFGTTNLLSKFHVKLEGAPSCRNRSTALFRSDAVGGTANVALEGNQSTTGDPNVASVNFVNLNPQSGASWHMSMRGPQQSNNLELHYRANGITGTNSYADCSVKPAPLYYWRFRGSDGYFESRGTLLPSDRRLKKDIEPLPAGVLSKVRSLTGVSYRWKDQSKGKKYLGVIAQEVETAFPDLVEEGSDGFKRVNFDSFSGVFVEAVKELARHNETLEKEIRFLREEIKEIRQALHLQK